MERTMKDHVKRPIDGSDKPVTTLAIVDRCYRVVKANGVLSGARACATSWQAATRGVVPRIPK
jgi:hypothetical protein